MDVLFIHGWWATDWVWSEMSDVFQAAGFGTHTLSLPGPETNQSTVEGNIQRAHEVARSIGNPILIGHSAGGLMAMKMCETIRPPACVAITPAPPLGVLPRPSTLLLRFIVAALPSLFLGREFFPRALLRQIALNRLDPDQQDDTLSRMRPVSASQVRTILPSLMGVDGSRLIVPLLIIGACEDRLTPPAQTRAIARRYGADYREYPNAGHFVLLETTCSELTIDLVSWLKENALSTNSQHD